MTWVAEGGICYEGVGVPAGDDDAGVGGEVDDEVGDEAGLPWADMVWPDPAMTAEQAWREADGLQLVAATSRLSGFKGVYTSGGNRWGGQYRAMTKYQNITRCGAAARTDRGAPVHAR